MMEKIKRFLKDEEGASMAEYAILIALVTLFLVGLITLFRDAIGNVFTAVTGALNSATT
jgi:pilus assembly protein Flp/PilA